MHTRSKWRSLPKREPELQNQSVTNATKSTEENKKLELYTVVNLGPRGSKGKVIKIERN